MARIRSIFPQQWTDEHFVSCSFAARLLALGLRNEADDNGIFEWKPLGIKMRLFPADDVDVAALLAELVESNQVRQYECNGKSYGAIRNFRTYQSPRSPKAQFPITEEIEAYVSGSNGEKQPVGRPSKQHSAETQSPKPEQFPQNAENNSVMEREEGEGGSLRAESPPDVRTELFQTGRESLQRQTGKLEHQCRPLLGKLLKASGDDANKVLQAILQAERDKIADPVSWLMRILSPPAKRSTASDNLTTLMEIHAERQASEAGQDEITGNVAHRISGS